MKVIESSWVDFVNVLSVAVGAEFGSLHKALVVVEGVAWVQEPFWSGQIVVSSVVLRVPYADRLALVPIREPVLQLQDVEAVTVGDLSHVPHSLKGHFGSWDDTVEDLQPNLHVENGPVLECDSTLMSFLPTATQHGGEDLRAVHENIP